jgi:DNA-binding response OmpR family regulator
MPFASGLEIISLVRNELKRNTPIIMLTSVGVEATELEAFRVGVNEFITKPFSPQVLHVRIEKTLAQLKK